MQELSRKNIFRAGVVLFLIMAGIALGYIYRNSHVPLINRGAGHLRAILYFGLIIAWALSVSQRIMQKQVRLYLLVISALMVFWLLARTMRYLFVIEDQQLYRFLWYSYYIPIVMIPLIGLFVALYLGQAEDYRLPRWLKLLYIPASLLILLVMTNNIHQQVFVFVEGDPALKTFYQYRFGYWLVFAWMLVFASAMLTILIAKSRVPRDKKVLWLPLVPLATYFVYAVLYAVRVPFIHTLIGDMTVVFCLLIMALFESLIKVGLIRSNTNYAGLLYASGIAAQIVDNDYKVYYQGASARPLAESVMRQAEKGPIELDRVTRLSSVAINGGHALWLEDISEMNRMLAQLKEVGERLSENNHLLQAELELKERQATVDEKNRIFDKVTHEVSAQLKKLDTLMASDLTADDSLRDKLIWLCILGTYIKRRSNLVILSEDGQSFFAKELEYCLLESSEAISACGIDCTFKRNCSGNLATDDALLLYDLFEEIVELSLPDLSALFISVETSDESASLKLLLNCNPQAVTRDKIKNLFRLQQRGGRFSERWEDETLYLNIHLGRAGESG